jgi:hypothetical protein
MEMCFKDQSGQLPGKTIVFAMTKQHAHRIAGVFEEMYPQHVGVVQIVTSTTERVRDGSYGDGLITKFKKNSLPRIAIIKLENTLLPQSARQRGALSVLFRCAGPAALQAASWPY